MMKIFLSTTLSVVLFSACSFQEGKTGYPNFSITIPDKAADLDLSPHHARMCAAYKDRMGVNHLFVDYIDTSAHTLASWGAEIKYYSRKGKSEWIYQGMAVEKGNDTIADLNLTKDTYGVASPAVLATDSIIYLFYAGRQLTSDSILNCRIFLATAAADMHGAPKTEFIKRGMMVDIGSKGAWDEVRLDDPNPVIVGDSIYLYFKGLTHGGGASRKLGLAKASLNDLKFKKIDRPIHSIEGGLEMPRIFRYKNQWHMFFRSFHPAENYLWQHFISENGIRWKAKNLKFWNKEFPSGRVTDMTILLGMNGVLDQPAQVIATGMENEIMKLWLLDLHIEEE